MVCARDAGKRGGCHKRILSPCHCYSGYGSRCRSAQGLLAKRVFKLVDLADSRNDMDVAFKLAICLGIDPWS